MGKVFDKGGKTAETATKETGKEVAKEGAKKAGKYSKDEVKKRFESGAAVGGQLSDAFMGQQPQGGGASVPLMSDAPAPPNFTQPGAGMFSTPFAQASNQYLSVKSPFFGIPGGGERRKPLPPDEEEEEDIY